MMLEDVLPKLREGEKAQRDSWKDPNSYVQIEASDKGVQLVYMFAGGKQVPWQPANPSDILDDDWQMVEGDED